MMTPDYIHNLDDAMLMLACMDAVYRNRNSLYGEDGIPQKIDDIDQMIHLLKLQLQYAKKVKKYMGVEE